MLLPPFVPWDSSTLLCQIFLPVGDKVRLLLLLCWVAEPGCWQGGALVLPLVTGLLAVAERLELCESAEYLTMGTQGWE